MSNRWRFIISAVLAALVFILSIPIVRPALAAVVLEVGSRGDHVTRVQKRLIQYGYLEGEADGRYGEDTQEAVKLFQRRNGLNVDGRVGADTAAALGVSLKSGGTVSAVSAGASSSEQRLLARLIYAEARGESYKGKVAVGAVVLNRVRSSQFPNTLSGVIYQKNAFESVTNGSINNQADSSCLRAAKEAMNGWDPTGGCLYFYNAATVSSNSWIHSRTVKTVIGRHSFAV